MTDACFSHSVAGGISQIVMTPALQTLVRGARSKYQEYGNTENKEKARKDDITAKKKTKEEELTTTQEKRRRLETDCRSMEMDADKLAEQAENTSNLTRLATSNALQHGAKNKRN